MLIWMRAKPEEKNEILKQMESISERLLKSGLALEREWNVTIMTYQNENYVENIHSIDRQLETVKNIQDK